MPHVCVDSGGFPSCLSQVKEEQLSDVWSGESPSCVLVLALEL